MKNENLILDKELRNELRKNPKLALNKLYNKNNDIEIVVVTNTKDTTYIAVLDNPNIQLDGDLGSITAAVKTSTASSVGSAGSAGTIGTVASCVGTFSTAGSVSSAGSINVGT